VKANLRYPVFPLKKKKVPPFKLLPAHFRCSFFFTLPSLLGMGELSFHMNGDNITTIPIRKTKFVNDDDSFVGTKCWLINT
jgi:hypothetical protein